MENAWVTELHVRMDCNGCVHKVKKAVHGLEGVYETRVDFGTQMITVVGKASPEQIVRAIRKGARKTAAVHSHNGPPGDQPPPAADEAPPPAPEPEEAAPPPPPAEVPPPAENPSPEPPPQQPEGPDQEKPMVHMYPYHELNRGHYWDGYDYAPRVTSPVPYYTSSAVHSYNTYTPPPSHAQYLVVEQGYNHFPAQLVDQRHDGGYYHGDYHYQRPRGGDRMGAMFSDENPNACRIC